MAAERGLALIAPDTSPRGAGVAGETDSLDFGVGAGFYLDATQAPWSKHYRMESYLLQDLLPLIGNAVLIPVVRFYLLMALPQLSERLHQLVPPRLRSRVNGFVGDGDVIHCHYWRGQLLVMIIRAVY